MNICNDAVQSYIDASVDEDGFTYFFSADQGGFTTVDETTSFYIREDGVPVVVFPEYSIAAGAAGTIEVPVETPGLKISDRFREGGFCRPLLLCKSIAKVTMCRL